MTLCDKCHLEPADLTYVMCGRCRNFELAESAYQSDALNECHRKIDDLEHDLELYRNVAQKDYEDMRRFQAKFIETDHQLRECQRKLNVFNQPKTNQQQTQPKGECIMGSEETKKVTNISAMNIKLEIFKEVIRIYGKESIDNIIAYTEKIWQWMIE